MVPLALVIFFLSGKERFRYLKTSKEMEDLAHRDGVFEHKALSKEGFLHHVAKGRAHAILVKGAVSLCFGSADLGSPGVLSPSN